MKAIILAAGKGTRNNDVKGLHKALLPLENRPIISHIIDKLDKKNIFKIFKYRYE